MNVNPVNRTSRILVPRSKQRPGAPVRRALRATGVRASAASALGASAIGTIALGALAVGALAMGALAIGRLAIGRARIRRLDIDDLVVRRLRVVEDLRGPGTGRIGV